MSWGVNPVVTCAALDLVGATDCTVVTVLVEDCEPTGGGDHATTSAPPMSAERNGIANERFMRRKG